MRRPKQRTALELRFLMQTDGKPREFLDPEALSRLARLPLVARRPMQGTVSGRHVSPHRGASVEFAEYRRYVPGDDLRRLDWRALARSDRYYVKQFAADTNLRCSLVVDASASMRFGAMGETKIDYARRLVGTLGYLAGTQGDAVGLAAVGETITCNIPPRRNPAHLAEVFDALEAIEPDGTTGLLDGLHELAETLGQRALVVVVSDFFVEPEPLRSAWEHLRDRRHDVIALHLLDPAELEFSFRRPMRFVDLEGGDAILTSPEEIRPQYLAALDAYLEAVQRMAWETAIDYRRVRLDDDYEQVLLSLLASRVGGPARR